MNAPISVTFSVRMPKLYGVRLKIGAWFIRFGCWVASVKSLDVDVS